MLGLFKRGEDEGANLVEFALLAPLLFLILFGIIEFGWVLSQHLDVRHGAREGARLAAVNFPEGPPPNSDTRSSTNTDDLVEEICNRMQTASGVEIEITSAGGVGDPADIRVTAPAATLTGFLDWAIPTNLELASDVQIRMEQKATWDDTTGAQGCPSP